MILDTVSTQEIAWVLITAIGFGINLRGFILSIGDRRAVLKSKKNGARKMIANDGMVSDAVSTFVQLSLLMVGVAAMFVPPNPTPSRGMFQSFVVLMLFLAASSLVGKSIYRQVRRAQLEDYMDRYYEEDDNVGDR